MRVFNTCLNKEKKIFNCSIIAITVSVLMLVLVGLRFGIVFGLGGAVIGYVIGSYLGRCWYIGKLQRYLYWHLPFASFWLDQSVPDSHLRKFI